MKLTRILTCFLTLLPALGTGAGSLQPRTDINPALIYWQAFSIFPEVSQAFGPDWLEQTPGPQETALARKFDGSFKLLRRAAQMKAPCDWGVDLADGPGTVLPNLAKIRRAVQAGLLRARVALEEGREADAKDDLLAILALSRHSARDGALVQVMVHIASHDLLMKFVAGNLPRFTSESLRQLAEAPSPMATVAQAVSVERSAMFGWFLAHVESFHAAHPADDAKAFDLFRELMRRNIDGGSDKSANRLIEASGGTGAGLVEYIRQAAPVYDAMNSIATAAHEQVQSRIEDFNTTYKSRTNLVVELLVPNIGRARIKELEVTGRVAMLRAAVAYRIGGEPAFRQVQDPFGDGPFERRALEQGFELRSKLALEGAKSVMAFAE